MGSENWEAGADFLGVWVEVRNAAWSPATGSWCPSPSCTEAPPLGCWVRSREVDQGTWPTPRNLAPSCLSPELGFVDSDSAGLGQKVLKGPT